MNKTMRDLIINSFNEEHFINDEHRKILETLIDKGTCTISKEYLKVFEKDGYICDYLTTKPHNWDITSDIIHIYFDINEFMDSPEFRKKLNDYMK